MKNIFLISLFFTLSIPMFAQQGKGNRVESLKIAYLSNQLNLDPKTAELFWPIYNNYQNELEAVVLERRKLNQNDNRTAEEILDQEQKALDIKKKYNAQFLKVMDNNQINRLYQSEKEFRKIIMRRSERMQNRQDAGNEQPNRMESPRMNRPMNDRSMNERSMERQAPRQMAPPPPPASAPAQRRTR